MTGTDLTGVDHQMNPAPAVNLGTILVIEDDPRMQKVLRRIFTDEHYNVALPATARPGSISSAPSTRLPWFSISFFLVSPVANSVRRSRIISNETPIIVLSAISEVADKVLLLELGADDYVTKPFSPRELTARVQAAIRRQRKPAAANTSVVLGV